ncbi:hypothetical protein NADFUDRAFT_77604 [Nadsonia fulvescens var. elongata DSM 6958]|uniref:Zn(2)-C6 fungal-type domain-containing protein n=1 Tax=Nadsonia fulvescens var. elongata DSM 6958 TaxID=857566 RepID=A0A1E3PQT9_9ASCO|nr:hypothetical protein NADFUDRAFT_77604 [Nadsonia fulvescens var. elongata DSM 6958]
MPGDTSSNHETYPIFTRRESEEHLSKKSRTTSCERCKRRKQRCDHRLPTCTGCLKAGAKCIQPERYHTRIPDKDDYTIYLEQRVKSLESALASAAKYQNLTYQPKQLELLDESRPMPYKMPLPPSQKLHEIFKHDTSISPDHSSSLSSRAYSPYSNPDSRSLFSTPLSTPDVPSDNKGISLDNQINPNNADADTIYERKNPVAAPKTCHATSTSPKKVDPKSKIISTGEPCIETETTHINRTVSILNLDPDVEAPQSFSVVSSMLEESIWDRTVQREKTHPSEDLEKKPQQNLNNLLLDFTFESLLSKYDDVAPPEPELAKKLVDGYLARLHNRIPVLARNVVVDIFETKNTVSTDSKDTVTRLNKFRLYIIYAIMATTSRMIGLYDGSDVLGIYATAVRQGKMCQTNDPMLQVEALFLCSFLQTRIDFDDGRHWVLIDRAMEIAVREKMHLESSYKKYDLYTQQLKKRLFWSLYCLERLLSVTTNRPYRLLEKNITVILPLDIDDFITDENLIREVMNENKDSEETKKQTNLTHYVRIIELRRLESEIIENVCRVNKSLESRFPEVQPFLDRLKKWQVVSRSTDEFEYISAKINYAKSVRILIQPFLGRIDPYGQLFQECMEACGDLCSIFKKYHRRTTSGFSTPGIHTIFMAGLTLVYGFWLSRDFWPLHLMSYLRDCSYALYVMAEHFSTGRGYKETFERLLSGTLQQLKEKTAYGHFPHPDLRSPNQSHQSRGQPGPESNNVASFKLSVPQAIKKRNFGETFDKTTHPTTVDEKVSGIEPEDNVSGNKLKLPKLSNNNDTFNAALNYKTPEPSFNDVKENIEHVKAESGQTASHEYKFQSDSPVDSHHEKSLSLPNLPNNRPPLPIYNPYTRAQEDLIGGSELGYQFNTTSHYSPSGSQSLKETKENRKNLCLQSKSSVPVANRSQAHTSRNFFVLPSDSVSVPIANDVVRAPASSSFDKRVVISLDHQNGLLKSSWSNICQYDESMYNMIQDISVWTNGKNTNNDLNNSCGNIDKPSPTKDDIPKKNNDPITERSHENITVDATIPKKITKQFNEPDPFNTTSNILGAPLTATAASDGNITNHNANSSAPSSLFSLGYSQSNINEMGLYMDDYPWDSFNDYGFF